MKKSVKKIIKRAAIAAGTVAAGVGTLVVIQKIAAKKGVSIGITPDQITPENEVISKILCGTVAVTTGFTCGSMITSDIISEKRNDIIEKLDKLVKASADSNSSNQAL